MIIPVLKKLLHIGDKPAVQIPAPQSNNVVINGSATLPLDVVRKIEDEWVERGIIR